MLKSIKFAHLILNAILLFLCSCDNSNPSGPSAIDSSLLKGKWVRTNITYSYTFIQGNNNYSDSGTMIDTTVVEIMEFDTNTLFRYYFDNNDLCYDYGTEPYSLLGNHIIGLEFTGSDTNEGTITTYATDIITLSTNNLTIESTVIKTGEVNGSGTEKYFYQKYTEQFPPTGWPLVPCLNKRLNQRKYRFFTAFKSN